MDCPSDAQIELGLSDHVYIVDVMPFEIQPLGDMGSRREFVAV